MKLVIEDEAGTRSVVPFPTDEITVGRAADGVTFRLHDRNVSRRHARFVLGGGGVYVEDLGSLVGTCVNGERIAGRRKLRAGDLVEIGDYDLAVVGDDDTPAPGAPPPLPPTPRPTAPAAVVEPTPPRPPTPRPWTPPPASPPAATTARTPHPGGTLRRALALAIVGLALGVAAGYATSRLHAEVLPGSGMAR